MPRANAQRAAPHQALGALHSRHENGGALNNGGIEAVGSLYTQFGRFHQGRFPFEGNVIFMPSPLGGSVTISIGECVIFIPSPLGGSTVTDAFPQ